MTVKEVLNNLESSEKQILAESGISDDKLKDIIFERNILLTYLKFRGVDVLSSIICEGCNEQKSRLMRFQEEWCRNPFGYNPYEVCNIEDGLNYFKQLRG